MNEPSYLSLVHNAALLLALVFLFDLMMTRNWLKHTRLWQVILGLILGGIGLIIMLTPWILMPGIIFDTRSVLLGISGLFFGAIPTLIAMAITAVFRLYQGGTAAWAGVLVILATGTIGILWRRSLHKPLETLTAWRLYLFGLVINIAMLLCMFSLPFNIALQVLGTISLPVLIIYPPATMALGLLLINRLHRERMAEDQTRSEERLRQSEERYAAIINNLPNGMIHILDREFRYVFNAGEGLADAGLTDEMLVGKSIFDVLGSETGSRLAAAYQQVLAGETVHFEGDYNEQYFVTHAAPLWDAQGDITQILTLSMNITARKKAEEELLHAQAELQKMLNGSEQARRALLSVLEDQKTAEEKLMQLNSELEQRVQERTTQLESANKELEAFVYSVSHDLRAPLRALDGFSAVLLQDYQSQLDAQGKHFLDRIQEASRKMGQLIEDLLNLSRVTHRAMKLETIDLSAMVLRIAQDLRDQAPGRVIEFDIAPDLLIRADAGLIKIALENLLNNAVKFTGKRSLAQIQVGMMEQSGIKVYFVRDNGAGFNMAYADKLFTPFQRLHGELEFPGTGIGLVIVHRIISRHGGRLWAKANVDEGATFYFTLEGK